ncbi:MAG TPA: outer membrane protein assembly factor BamD [Bacteroidota bacterium]|nr:outer membrane protein assembly factor BamD [Bacteroidota bacterium]
MKTPLQHLFINIIFWFGISILLWNIGGCSSEEITKQMTAEQHYQLGMKEFKAENYLDAIEEFKIVGLQYQGTRVADAAQFYMGECHFYRGEYILAAYEYDLLIRTMPASPYVARARFQMATCYYNMSPGSSLDQDYSKKALDEYQAYIDYFPNDTLVHAAEVRINELNTKAAQKEYENGITYMHMEYYRAAAFYFDLVLEKYHDSPYAEPAQLKKAEAMMNRKKYSEAQKELDKFFVKYTHSSLLADAEKLKEELKSRIAEAASQPPPKAKPAQAPASVNGN